MDEQRNKVVRALRGQLRLAAQKSGLTRGCIAVKMGLAKEAQPAVSRLLGNGPDYDPRLSSFVACAHALGLQVRLSPR